jgi:hypothetical protein
METTPAVQETCEAAMIIDTQDEEILFWRNFAKDLMVTLGDSDFKAALFSALLRYRSHIDYYNLDEPILSFLDIRHWEFDEYRDRLPTGLQVGGEEAGR